MYALRIGLAGTDETPGPSRIPEKMEVEITGGQVFAGYAARPGALTPRFIGRKGVPF